jgi:hypothetical protein
VKCRRLRVNISPDTLIELHCQKLITSCLIIERALIKRSAILFEDCLQGGKPKAETAAEAMKKIFPGMV